VNEYTVRKSRLAERSGSRVVPTRGRFRSAPVAHDRSLEGEGRSAFRRAQEVRPAHLRDCPRAGATRGPRSEAVATSEALLRLWRDARTASAADDNRR